VTARDLRLWRQASRATSVQEVTRIVPPEKASRSGQMTASDPEKPRWRGVSHQIAFFICLALGPLLVIEASTPKARITAAVYALSLIALFGCSALLHRGTWSDAARPWFRRLDHSMIFVFIAGTYTPITVLALPTGEARLTVIAAWTAAAVGVVVTVFWIEAPRWVTAGCYLVAGWIAVLALPGLWSGLGPGRFALLAIGAGLYTLGAVVYARKRPDPAPETFGYHEVFHALVIAAVACHYALITVLVRA
jgi:hemolysin III